MKRRGEIGGKNGRPASIATGRLAPTEVGVDATLGEFVEARQRLAQPFRPRRAVERKTWLHAPHQLCHAGCKRSHVAGADEAAAKQTPFKMRWVQIMGGDFGALT